MNGRSRRISPLALTASAWIFGLAATVAVAQSTHLMFGIHSADAHLVLDTVDTCVALLVTYLLWGRFWRAGQLQDLLLAEAFFLLALASVLSVAAAASTEPHRWAGVAVWAGVALRLAAAVLVASSSLAGGDRPRVRRRLAFQRIPVVLPLALPLGGVAGVVTTLWLVGDSLPAALPQVAPPSAADPVITGHPVLLAAQIIGALAFALASVVVTVRASRRRDVLLEWLGPACAIAAFARVCYFLFPSLYTDWVYAGDLLRTGGYALLLVGATREIREYWTGLADRTVRDDRKRLSRELHDGVVQELGYIRAVTLAQLDDGAVRKELVAACDRATDEARSAVDALGRSPEEPLGLVLQRAACQVADRYGGGILVDVDDAANAADEQRHALVRITREAVSNALRHGAVSTVTLRLERGLDGHCLFVTDCGKGFDPRLLAAGAGYGLTSMRDRAAALPGTFDIWSEPGHGTRVTVTW